MLLDLAELANRGRSMWPSPAANIANPRAGNVLEVLEAALWAFRSTDNFRDGALKAANLGANSDAVAARCTASSPAPTTGSAPSRPPGVPA